MSESFECDHDDCENTPTLVRELSATGSKFQYCEAHDPLEDEGAAYAFQERITKEYRVTGTIGRNDEITVHTQWMDEDKSHVRGVEIGLETTHGWNNTAIEERTEE